MNRHLIFMGTGPFALCALEGIYHNLKDGDTLAVYTKEAKKTGRGMKVKDGCVAEFAREKNLPLYQPHSLKEETARSEFLALEKDLVIVASYGLILPKYVLDSPTFGCVNIHASLLPKYRGAAPIHRAILNGEKITGVTIMQMNEGLDTGDMLIKKEIAIGENECVGELHDRLAVLGRDTLLEILPSIYASKLKPIPQKEEESSYAAKITSEDQILDFSLSTTEVLAKIRGLSPIPGALCHTEKDGKILKILSASPRSSHTNSPNGTIISVKPEILVQTGDGAIALHIIQPEGKGKMSAQDAVNGRRIALGDTLIS